MALRQRGDVGAPLAHQLLISSARSASSALSRRPRSTGLSPASTAASKAGSARWFWLFAEA
ncbi:hypothetical protein OZ12_12925 [Xanthomonas translucens pv. translucens]|nr:hypothetical protein OZ12_12925 [Xanthomonas translucens pv. translucens]KWV13307.1 hypothetical protein ATB54_14190 [Xanthomonas translucens]OAX60698.1 hypothetical protein A6R79_10475 [Xanthomonas translucens pv. translucens]